jgi:hypothetical protein
MRRNVLAPTFWISPEARERARAGERLLADAVRAQVSGQPRLVGNTADEVLQMANALHTAGLLSDADMAALHASLDAPPARKTTDLANRSLLRRR